MLHVHVPIMSIPQGSMHSFAHKTTGKIVTIANNREALYAYRDAIGTAYKVMVPGKYPTFPTEPVEIEMVFRLPRPKSHYTTKGLLKVNALTWVTVKPDTDKLVRATLDALTKIAFNDDAQVVVIKATKVYTSGDPSTCILIGEALPPESVRPW